MSYRYIGVTYGFGGSGSTAWDTLKAKRDAMGASLSAKQSSLSSYTAAIANAHQDKLNGLGTLAANAAISRIKADAKVRQTALLKQIDGAQNTLDAAKNATAAKTAFVSWALPQTTDTTTTTDSTTVDTTA